MPSARCTTVCRSSFEEKDWPKWLGEGPAEGAELKALFAPCASEHLKFWPVGKQVGNVKNDSPDLVELMAEA